MTCCWDVSSQGAVAKRNPIAKSKGVVVRRGLKEAGGEPWTERTGSGYKAGMVGVVTDDTKPDISLRTIFVDPIRTRGK